MIANSTAEKAVEFLNTLESAFTSHWTCDWNGSSLLAVPRSMRAQNPTPPGRSLNDSYYSRGDKIWTWARPERSETGSVETQKTLWRAAISSPSPVRHQRCTLAAVAATNSRARLLFALESRSSPIFRRPTGNHHSAFSAFDVTFLRNFDRHCPGANIDRWLSRHGNKGNFPIALRPNFLKMAFEKPLVFREERDGKGDNLEIGSARVRPRVPEGQPGRGPANTVPDRPAGSNPYESPAVYRKNRGSTPKPGMEEVNMIRGGSDQHFACAACGNPASVWQGSLVSRPHNVGKRFGQVSAEAAEHPPRGSRYCGGFENLNPDLDPVDPRVQTREWTRYPWGTLSAAHDFVKCI
ncbi:hypothetical protein DFH09DRAFT_1103117 [Mycena vulgaris]|nr:hypothetical protein DFH09DRAFT_1103117 [Mycena vulgaris]